jgi:hypothetical protein
MKAALIILTALLLIGCSTERRCARAVNRCAALWRHDTTYVHDSITIQRNTIDTVLRWNFLPVHDTVTIRDGRAVIRIVRLPGDSIWLQGECRDTVIRYVRQVVTVQAKREPLPWRWVVAGMAAAVLLFLLVIRNRR